MDFFCMKNQYNKKSTKPQSEEVREGKPTNKNKLLKEGKFR